MGRGGLSPDVPQRLKSRNGVEGTAKAALFRRGGGVRAAFGLFDGGSAEFMMGFGVRARRRRTGWVCFLGVEVETGGSCWRYRRFAP